MKKNAILLAAMLALAACSADRISSIPAYRLDIIQGNQLDSEAIGALKTGMSRDQVQLLLGTPLLRTPFQADRWDYTFEIRQNGIAKSEETRKLTLWFENSRLLRFEGSAIEYAAQQIKQPQAAAGR